MNKVIVRLTDTGFQIVKSTVPGFVPGEMIMHIEPLKKAGLTVEILDKE